MILQFLSLQWKSFVRSASFSTHLAIKILMGFLMLYFAACFIIISVLVYYILEKETSLSPFLTVNQYLIYGSSFWILMRYFLQKIPVMNITPLLLLPISKNNIVHFAMAKTLLSAFNWLSLMFLIPFSIVLAIEGFASLGVFSWFVGVFSAVLCTNYLNLLINNNDKAWIVVASVLAVFAGLQYYEIFDITVYSGPVFQSFYDQPLYALVPLLILFLLYKGAFQDYKKAMYLDGGLAPKRSVAKTQNFAWMDRFGNTAIFLKNDLRLILRNKRSKTTALLSGLFLFYGLLFFTGDLYENPAWKIFAGIFVSGGFLFSFGQYVPSWDSSYYPLLMTQNTSYREYITSKWALIVVTTGISFLLATPYIYLGWDAYLSVLVGAIYNIGVNSHLVLWGGAYIKTPIDLTSNKKAFGDKQAFNAKTLMLSLPKMVLPLLIFWLGSYLHSSELGFGLVALVGVLGLAFRNEVFKIIEGIYKSEKHKTLWAYKQK